MCRSTCSLQNIFELWLLIVHSLQIFDILHLLLLPKLHINSIELLLQSSHTSIEIRVDFLFLCDDDPLATLSALAPLLTAVWSNNLYLVLVEIWHHLSLVFEVSIPLVT